MPNGKELSVPSFFIDKFIRPSCHNDERIVSAFTAVPRDHFVDEAMRLNAYTDNAQPIGFGQTISQPSLVAMMLYELDVEPHHKCLEIGAGSGFVAALLSKLAKEVYAVELLPELANRARGKLRHIHIRNTFIITADGSLGYPKEAPYDRILVSAGAASLPQSLLDQLADNGIMIIPLSGILTKVTKTEDAVSKKALAKVAFVDFINT